LRPGHRSSGLHRARRHAPELREPADLGDHKPPKGERSRLTSDPDQRSSEAEQRASEIVRLFELDDSLIEGLADLIDRPHHDLGEQLLPDGRESAGGSPETAELDDHQVSAARIESRPLSSAIAGVGLVDAGALAGRPERA
jgi:hypothetical protein